MIVVVIIGVIAGFGLPTFTKIIRKSHERNAILGVITISKANEIYAVKNGDFFPENNQNLDQINTGLSIDLKSLGLTYTLWGPPPFNTFRAEGEWTSGFGADFTVRAIQGPISIGGGNPCCLPPPGSCPTLPDC